MRKFLIILFFLPVMALANNLEAFIRGEIDLYTISKSNKKVALIISADRPCDQPGGLLAARTVKGKLTWGCWMADSRAIRFSFPEERNNAYQLDDFVKIERK